MGSRNEGNPTQSMKMSRVGPYSYCVTLQNIKLPNRGRLLWWTLHLEWPLLNIEKSGVVGHLDLPGGRWPEEEEIYKSQRTLEPA